MIVPPVCTATELRMSPRPYLTFAGFNEIRQELVGLSRESGNPQVVTRLLSGLNLFMQGEVPFRHGLGFSE